MGNIMSSNQSIQELIANALDKMRDLVDTQTVIGKEIKTEDGTVIIPVSKVTFGFASGGSEFNNKNVKAIEENKFPFGGGAGAGVNIDPMAFLVVKNGETKLLTLNNITPTDKLVEMIPTILNKITGINNKNNINQNV